MACQCSLTAEGQNTHPGPPQKPNTLPATPNPCHSALASAVPAQPPEPSGGAEDPPPPRPPAEHLALVDAVNLGKPGAFEALFRTFNPFVLRIASRLCRDQADTLDVQQAVWLYVARKFPGLVLTGRFTTFLYPVIRHEAAAVRRKRSRLGDAGSDIADAALDRAAAAGRPPTASASASHPGEPDAPDERLARLHALLAALSPVHREIVLMRFVDDLSLEEIAAVLDVPLGTVKSRLHNAIAALRADERSRAWFNH